jgi:hypothetical protein
MTSQYDQFSSWLTLQNLLPLMRNLFFTTLGAALSYSKWGRKKLKVYYLSDILDVLALSPTARVLFELCIFIFIGCAISIGIVRPQNAAQAFSAGLGWTGLAGRVR